MQLIEDSDRAADFLSWNPGLELFTLFDIVKRFRADLLYGFSRGLEGLVSFMDEMAKPHASLSESTRKDLIRFSKKVKKGCQQFNLPASVQACDDLKELSKDHHVSVQQIQLILLELNKRIEVELQAHVYLYIPKEDSSFYAKPLDEWGDTITAFPSIRYDIEEASKSLALQRNTAAVFHLMRVMSAGVKAMGKSLNEPALDASHNLTWDNVLRRCAKESEKEFKDMSPVWQSDKQFFATATAKLYAVKDAWRNPNAHEIGDKYTSEETLDIYRAIRSFMRQLATKLKEAP